MPATVDDAAHGGPGWSPRTKSLRQEFGSIWNKCGVDSEWAPLKTVLMHRPGPEIEAITNARGELMENTTTRVRQVTMEQDRWNMRATPLKKDSASVLWR